MTGSSGKERVANVELLELVFRLERLLSLWNFGPNATLAKISESTQTSIAIVVDAFSLTLNKEFDVQDVVTQAEAAEALKCLQQRMQPQIAARQRKIAEKQDKAVKAYDSTMEKLRVLQGEKNWRSAYKTLAYFVGSYEKDLPGEYLLSLYGDCLRLAVKSSMNLQEISLWFKKAIEFSLANPSQAIIADVIDFIDAYGVTVMEAGSEQGQRLVVYALNEIKQSAQEYDLALMWNQLAVDLNLMKKEASV